MAQAGFEMRRVLLVALLGACASPAQEHADAGEPPGDCLPGASASDCALCELGLEGCTRACPNCDGWPLPEGCSAVCAGAPCCACARVVGTEHGWGPKQVTCATSCRALEDRWDEAVRAPAMKQCTGDSDCGVAGGPRGHCGCDPALGGCGQAVNRAAYAASPAAGWSATFVEDCAQGPRVCDCAPVRVGCVQGLCSVQRIESCFVPADGGQ